MRRLPRNLQALGAIFAILVFVAIAVIVYQMRETPYSEVAEIGVKVKSFQDLEERFEKIANEKGAVYAFEVLKRAQLPPNTDLHLLGHVVGDILYTQKGVDGIADCTQDFRNACSHSIVIGALNEFGGEPALQLIRDACRAAPGGAGAYTMCYHGLGHGVFAFFGYSFPETVALCNDTGTAEYHDREAVECIGGAVMELAGGGGHDRDAWLEARERYLDDPIGLCLSDDIPENAKGQCLTYLTSELWKKVGIDLGSPDPELFDDAFALCDVIPSSRPELRYSCYGGFGKEFVPLALARDIREIGRFAERETAIVEDWCSRAEAVDGRRSCIRQAVQSLFWGGENDSAITFRFCSLIQSEPLQDTCYQELDSAIHAYIREPERHDSLCAQVPSSFREECAKPVISARSRVE